MTEASWKEKALVDFSVVSLGLAFCRAWIVVILGMALVGSSLVNIESIFLFPGAIAAFIAAGVAIRKHNTQAVSPSLIGATGLSIVGFMLLAPFVLEAQNTWLSMLFLIIGGIASNCLQILWGTAFTQRGLQYSLRCYPSAAIMTALLVVLAASGTPLISLMVFPLVSGLLFLVSQVLPSKDIFTLGYEGIDEQVSIQGKKGKTSSLISVAMAQTPEISPLPWKIIIRLMISIGVFSFLCRLFDALPAADTVDPLESFGGSSLFALVVVGVLFLIFVFLVKGRFNALVVYRIAVPLMAFGMVISSLFFTSHWFMSVLLIGIGYELFDTLAWMLLVELSRAQKKQYSYQVIFGFGTGATSIGMGLGYLVGSLMYEPILVGDLEPTTVGIICVLVLIVAAFMLIPEGTISQVFSRKSDTTKASINEDVPIEMNPLKTRCLEVANTYRLTPRESEVLELLAKGRTLSIVMRDLGIAKGTAQTHIENIYQKLGVHKQQELIDLVEGYTEQEPPS